MSEWAQLITAIASLGALILSAFNAKAIKSVHISINSRMDQLLQERGAASKAEGREEERDRQKGVIS